MPIEDRKMVAGTVLVARYKTQDRTCEVVETADGLRYRLDDGTVHKSPSSAGKAAMGGVACNGWRFWSLQGTQQPKSGPKAKADKAGKEPAAKKSEKTKAAKKSSKPNKNKAMPSDALYGCGECPATFVTIEAATEHLATHTAA